MAAPWNMSVQAIHVLWQRAFPRVLASEWADQLNPNYGTGSINDGGLSPEEKGERLRAYINDHDADPANADNLLLGGEGIHAGMTIGIYSEADHNLRDRFMIYDEGIILPWPTKPPDTEAGIISAMQRYTNECSGLVAINLPGFPTIPMTRSLSGNGSLLRLSNVIALADAFGAFAMDPLDAIKLSFGAGHWFVEDRELYLTLIKLPRLVARAMAGLGRDAYEAMRTSANIDSFIAAVSNEVDSLPRWSFKGFASELTVNQEGILLTNLPAYPQDMQELYESWATGESHNPMYSNTPTQCPQ